MNRVEENEFVCYILRVQSDDGNCDVKMGVRRTQLLS